MGNCGEDETRKASFIISQIVEARSISKRFREDQQMSKHILVSEEIVYRVSIPYAQIKQLREIQIEDMDR